MNSLIQNVTSLTDFINATLLELDCSGDLNTQIDEALGYFATLINEIIINIEEIMASESVTEDMATNLSRFNEYLSSLKKMLDSFTITDAVNDTLLTDVILILINTSLMLVEILETLIGTDIANDELCEEIGNSIDTFLNKCVEEKLGLLQKVLYAWKDLLMYWINEISSDISSLEL